jgi:hypothetical protein
VSFCLFLFGQRSCDDTRRVGDAREVGAFCLLFGGGFLEEFAPAGLEEFAPAGLTQVHKRMFIQLCQIIRAMVRCKE